MQADQNALFDFSVWDDLLRLRELDAEDVLEQSRLSLNPGVSLAKFLSIIDFVRHFTLDEMRTSAIQKTDVALLERTLETYHQVSMRLYSYRESPPPLPPEWLNNSRTWIRQAKSHLGKRKPGRKESALNVSFYPWALAAFAVCFDKRPTDTIRGPTMRFANQILLRVREHRIQKLVLQTKDKPEWLEAHGAGLKYMLRSWKVPDDESAKTAIKQALKRPSSPTAVALPLGHEGPNEHKIVLEYKKCEKQLRLMFDAS